MKVWVLGAKGMLGRELVSLLKRLEIETIASSHSDVAIEDFLNVLTCAKEFAPTHIVNCAAFTDVDRAEIDREMAFLTNATGAENIAKVASLVGARLIHLSTDFVFPSREEPHAETDLCAPMNFYGWTKYQGELLVKSHCPHACIVRTSWLFGGEGKNLISNLLAWFQTKEHLHVVADQYGKPTYCVDLAEALLKLLESEEVFHFANAGKASRYEIALELFSLAKQAELPMICKEILPLESAQFPTLAARPQCSVLRTERFESLIGEVPRSWNAAFNDYMSHKVYG